VNESRQRQDRAGGVGDGRDGAGRADAEWRGARVVERLVFPDHHDYSPADVARIVSAGRAGELLATEKDLVKLAGRSGLEHLRGLRVTLQVDDGDRLVDLLEAAT